MENTNINELPSIKNWMKKRTKGLFSSFVTLTLLIVFFLIIIVMILIDSNSNTNITGIIPFVFTILIFIVLDVSTFTTWKHSFSEKVNRYWFVTIEDMYIDIKRSRKGRKRRYYIVANVNGKVMEAKCSEELYNKAQKGDEVLFFMIDNNEKVFCVYPYET